MERSWFPRSARAFTTACITRVPSVTGECQAPAIWWTRRARFQPNYQKGVLLGVPLRLDWTCPIPEIARLGRTVRGDEDSRPRRAMI
jgi:hypothetical protein